MQPNMRDAGLATTIALPNGAVTVTSPGLDIGPLTSLGQFAPAIDGEFLLEAPAVTTTELPNAATITYDIISSPNADMSSPTVERASALVQTGAGSAGAAAANMRFAPTTGARRYWSWRATGVAATLAATKKGLMTYVV